MDDKRRGCVRVGLAWDQPYCRYAVALACPRQQQSLAASDTLLLLRDHGGCRRLCVQQGKRQPLAESRAGFVERGLIMRSQLLYAPLGLRYAFCGELLHTHCIARQLFSEARYQILNLLDSNSLLGDWPTSAEEPRAKERIHSFPAFFVVIVLLIDLDT